MQAGVPAQRPWFVPLCSIALCQCCLALEEEISETTMWTAAAPQTARDKSRPQALSADDPLVLLGGGPRMPGRAGSSRFSLPRTHFISKLQPRLVMTLLTSEILGLSSLRGVSWKWRGQQGAG